MYKIYVTVLKKESNDSKSAVTVFEDYQLMYQSVEEIEHGIIGAKIAKKIEEVELSNEEATKPF